MATRAAPDYWLLCPYCGRPMLTVEIRLATPPYFVELSGCANCGITSNEFGEPEPSPTVAPLVRDYRD